MSLSLFYSLSLALSVSQILSPPLSHSLLYSLTLSLSHLPSPSVPFSLSQILSNISIILPHFHTTTHTHTLSLSLSLSLYLFLFLHKHTLPLSLTHTHTYIHAQTNTYFLTHFSLSVCRISLVQKLGTDYEAFSIPFQMQYEGTHSLGSGKRGWGGGSLHPFLPIWSSLSLVPSKLYFFP